MSQLLELILVLSVTVGYVLLVIVWPPQTAPRSSHGERLSALWLGLAVLMLVGRSAALRVDGAIWGPGGSPAYEGLLIAFAPYQDLFVVGVLAWIFGGFCILTSDTRLASTAYFTGYSVCIILAAYVTVNTMILEYTHLSLSYRLIWMPGFFGEVRRSVLDSITVLKLVKVIAAPLTIAMAASILWHRAPIVLARGWRAFFSPLGAAGLAAYFLAGTVVWARSPIDNDVVSNAGWSFVASLFEPAMPAVTDQFPASYLADFAPSPTNPAPRPSTAGYNDAAPKPVAQSSPLSVVMVVMESVGARQLEVCGAPYHDSPELVRLSRHAATFRRIYASTPWTSNAMAALLCSVYPYHDWQSTTHWFPDLHLPSLAQVLTEHGCRVAFLQSEDLRFDLEGQFLHRHGFAETVDRIGEQAASPLSAQTEMPRDPALFSAAIRWIQRDTSRPFFLVLWTGDTHAPYTSVRHEDFGVSDVQENRYLNSVRATDSLIGNLADELQTMGCADNTLIVVTGDHGEAFREHGRRWHGSTVYEEETRVPLMFINPRLFPDAMESSAIGQQVDVAPTILDLLHYDLPAGWQGRSLFAPSRPERAYLFDLFYFRFGLVEGRLKYIYDADTGRSQIYDLASDPREHHDLARENAYSRWAREAHRRLAAWFAFQNNYLRSLGAHAAPIGGGSRRPSHD